MILVVLIYFSKSIAQIYGNVVIDLTQFGLEMYGKPIAHHSRMNEKRYGNPEEQGPYLEGDLLIPLNSKNGIKLESYRWKNKEVPYEIRGSFSEFLT